MENSCFSGITNTTRLLPHIINSAFRQLCCFGFTYGKFMSHFHVFMNFYTFCACRIDSYTFLQIPAFSLVTIGKITEILSLDLENKDSCQSRTWLSFIFHSQESKYA